MPLDCTRTTTSELIALASDGGHAAWEVFAERYQPILWATGTRMGLSPDEAEDLAQDALLECWKALRDRTYNRERGRLRHYLLGILRNRVVDRLRRSALGPVPCGDDALVEVPDSVDELERLFEEEARHQILDLALEMLANRSGYAQQTVRAFERVHIDGLTPDEVARELGVTVQVVYNAASRCRRRLKQLSAELTELYDLV